MRFFKSILTIETLIEVRGWEDETETRKNQADREAGERVALLKASAGGEWTQAMEEEARKIRIDASNIAYAKSKPERKKVDEGLVKVFREDVRGLVGEGIRVTDGSSVVMKSSVIRKRTQRVLGKMAEGGVRDLDGARGILDEMYEAFPGEVEVTFRDFEPLDARGQMVSVELVGVCRDRNTHLELSAQVEHDGGLTISPVYFEGGSINDKFYSMLELNEGGRMVVMYGLVAGCVAAVGGEIEWLGED